MTPTTLIRCAAMACAVAAFASAQGVMIEREAPKAAKVAKARKQGDDKASQKVHAQIEKLMAALEQEGVDAEQRGETLRKLKEMIAHLEHAKVVVVGEPEAHGVALGEVLEKQHADEAEKAVDFVEAKPGKGAKAFKLEGGKFVELEGTEPAIVIGEDGMNGRVLKLGDGAVEFRVESGQDPQPKKAKKAKKAKGENVEVFEVTEPSVHVRHPEVSVRTRGGEGVDVVEVHGGEPHVIAKVVEGDEPHVLLEKVRGEGIAKRVADELHARLDKAAKAAADDDDDDDEQAATHQRARRAWRVAQDHAAAAEKLAERAQELRARAVEVAPLRAAARASEPFRVARVIRDGEAPHAAELRALRRAHAEPPAHAGGAAHDDDDDGELRAMIDELRGEMRELREMMREIRTHLRAQGAAAPQPTTPRSGMRRRAAGTAAAPRVGSDAFPALSPVAPAMPAMPAEPVAPPEALAPAAPAVPAEPAALPAPAPLPSRAAVPLTAPVAPLPPAEELRRA